MASKKPVPVAILAEGMPYVGAGVGNVGALSLTAYVHVVEADGAGALNSRVTTVQDLVNLVVIPAGGISQAFADGRYLQKLNNLSDVGSAVTSRANLNVYSIAQVDALIAGAAGSAFPHEAAVTKPTVAGGVLVQNLNPTFASTLATVVDATYGLYMRCPKLPSAGQALKFVRFASRVNAGVVGNAAATWTITGRFQNSQPNQGSYTACLVVRNPANDKMIFLGNNNGDLRLGGFYGNSAGGVAVSIGNPNCSANSFPWRRMVCDGTNISVQYGVDGIMWEELINTPLSTYINGGDLEFGIATLIDNNFAHGFYCNSFTFA